MAFYKASTKQQTRLLRNAQETESHSHAFPVQLSTCLGLCKEKGLRNIGMCLKSI